MMLHPPSSSPGEEVMDTHTRGCFCSFRSQVSQQFERDLRYLSAVTTTEGFLPVFLVTSLFKAATTAGRRWTHSVDLCPSHSTISWAYWRANRLPASVLFHLSTIPWKQLRSLSPRLTANLVLCQGLWHGSCELPFGMYLRKLCPFQWSMLVDGRQGSSHLHSCFVVAGYINHSQGMFVGLTPMK